MNHEIWTEQIASLSDYHCLAVDFPGHSNSRDEPWHSFADTAAQIAEIIRTRANDGRAHVVGISLGAIIGLELVVNHAAVVNRAVLSGTIVVPVGNTVVYRVMTHLMAWGLKSGLTGRAHAYMMRIPADYRDDYARIVNMTHPQALRRITFEVLDYRTPPTAAEATTPVLLVSGGADLKPYVESVNVLTNALPNAEGRIAPNVHHGWNGENPTLFSAMVRAWIEESPLPDELIAI